MQYERQRVVTWVALEIEDPDFPEVAIHQKVMGDRESVYLPPDRVADLIKALEQFAAIGTRFQDWRHRGEE